MTRRFRPVAPGDDDINKRRHSPLHRRAAAGWRELVMLPELRAVLHPMEALRHAA